MSSDNDIISAWRQASGCIEPCSMWSKNLIEAGFVRILDSQRFGGIPKGSAKSYRRVFEDLWNRRQSPYAIAYAIGVALDKGIHEISYVIGCLKNAPEEPDTIWDTVDKLVEEEENKSGDPEMPAEVKAHSTQTITDYYPKISYLQRDSHRYHPMFFEPQRTWDHLDAVRRKLYSDFNLDKICDSECYSCHGTGVEVLWFGTGGCIQGGICGNCRSCNPDPGPIKGVNIIPWEWIDGIYAPEIIPDNIIKTPKKNKPKKKSKAGWVYFVQKGYSGPIKIGWSTDVDNRICTLQTSSDEKLHLLHKIKGDMLMESMLHKMFKDIRLHGEWFNPEEYLLSYIKKGKDVENVEG